MQPSVPGLARWLSGGRRADGVGLRSTWLSFVLVHDLYTVSYPFISILSGIFELKINACSFPKVLHGFHILYANPTLAHAKILTGKPDIAWISNLALRFVVHSAYLQGGCQTLSWLSDRNDRKINDMSCLPDSQTASLIYFVGVL